MLSFELVDFSQHEHPEELAICCDRDGLASLIAQLQLLHDGRTEHVHLMAPLWGGAHLDDLPQDPTRVPIRHVKILLRAQ